MQPDTELVQRPAEAPSLRGARSPLNVTGSVTARPSGAATLGLPIIYLGIAIVGANVAPLLQEGNPLGVFGLLASLLGFALFFMSIPVGIAYFATTRLTFTDRRITGTSGLLRRKQFDFGLDAVEGLTVEQTVTERLFRAGSITIRGVGAGKHKMRYIRQPFAFRDAVNARLR
jgi:hypothetical protein